MRALRVAVSALRLALAAVLLGGVAWVLSWRILWEGVAGSDTLFHLQLVSWVSASWPGLDWWYRWDAGGLSYREGYPLAAAWLVAALARGSGLPAAGALQVIQFGVSPLCALGLYAFGAWRLRSPLAGLAAGLLYLLNPISWTFLVDWGFFANQVGTVLFMPCLIALDACFSGWLAGRRDWPWRLLAVAFAGLTALIGLVAPSVVWAPLLALFAYAAAATSRAAALRWLLLASPALALAALVLSAFWALPLQDYLAAVAARAPRLTYSPLLFHLWSPEQVLQLRPPRLAGPDSVYDRASLSPVAWLPALAGAALAVRDSRLRPLVLLAAFGLLSMTSQLLYAATFGIPLLPFVVHFRVGMLFLQFGVPLLAGAGLFCVLPRLLAWLLARLRLAHRRSWRLPAAWLAAAAGLALVGADVLLMGQPVAGASHSVAYGTFLDTGDIWHLHLDDPCRSGSPTGSLPCQSQALTSGFSLPELLKACRRPAGSIRGEVPICASLAEPPALRQPAADARLVAQTDTWCRRDGAGDQVCAARLAPLLDQLTDPHFWRRPGLRCTVACVPQREDLGAPVGRAMVDSHSAKLLQAFQLLTGRAQAYGYNSQLLPSPALDDLVKEGLLESARGTAAGDLARRAGVDAVVLGPQQGDRAARYRALGWRQVSAAPLVYGAPEPAAAAEQWAGGHAVLVLGATLTTGSEPYNEVMRWAAGGGLPSTEAWLVRGRSPYLDDYSDQELASYGGLWLLGYRYHDAAAAWQRVESFARSGGAVYVETGWQYVDPDWNSREAPTALPVQGLRWTELDPGARALVDGMPAGWESFTYQGGGWAASAAAGARPGAEAVVRVGERVVAARWRLGRGRLFWSGANLLAHAEQTHSQPETDFLASQWRWLLEAAGQQPRAAPLTPSWKGNDELALPLQPSSGPAWVLFKESNLPGWSAALETPSGVRDVNIVTGELDFALVRLDGVPAGSRLLLRFGPTWRVFLWWALSAAGALVCFAWLVRPGLLGSPAAELRARLSRGWTSEDG